TKSGRGRLPSHRGLWGPTPRSRSGPGLAPPLPRCLAACLRLCCLTSPFRLAPIPPVGRDQSEYGHSERVRQDQGQPEGARQFPHQFSTQQRTSFPIGHNRVGGIEKHSPVHVVFHLNGVIERESAPWASGYADCGRIGSVRNRIVPTIPVVTHATRT